MYLTLEDILQSNEMSVATVVAGEKGIDNPVRWYHIIEMEDMKNWISSNILVFITGVALHGNNESLKNIITSLSMKKASGLIINTGRYLKAVPEEIIDYADGINFPIITIPESVKLVELTYFIGQKIFTNNTKMNIDNEQVRQLLLHSDMYYNNSVANKFNVDIQTYIVCFIEIPSEIMNEVLLRIKEINKQFNISYVYHVEQAGITIIIQTQYKQMFLFCEKISYYFFLKKNEVSYRLYVSSEVSFLTEISEAYQEVIYLRNEYDFTTGTDIKNTVFYKDVYIYHLLSRSDKSQMKRIAKNNLGDLINNEILLHTLEVYLDNGFNTKQSAEVLCIHVNSMKYRLQKIKEILAVDMVKNAYGLKTSILICKFLL